MRVPGLIFFFLLQLITGFSQENDEALTLYTDVKKILFEPRNHKYEIIVSDRAIYGHFNGVADSSRNSYIFINDSIIRKQNLLSGEEDYFVMTIDSFFEYDKTKEKRKPVKYVSIERDSAGFTYIFKYKAGEGGSRELIGFERKKCDNLGRITGFYEWDKWNLTSNLTFTFEYRGDSTIEKGYRYFSKDSLRPYRDILSHRTLSKNKRVETITTTTIIYDEDKLANGEKPRTVTRFTRTRDRKRRLVRMEGYGEFSSDGNPDLVVEIEYRKR